MSTWRAERIRPTSCEPHANTTRSTGSSPIPRRFPTAVSGLSTYTYFRNGTRQTLTDPAGLVTTYSYDGQNRLATVTTAAGLAQYHISRTVCSRVSTLPNGVTATHRYDRADRVRSIVNAHGEEHHLVLHLHLRRNGNRRRRSRSTVGLDEGTTYTYDALDRSRRVSIIQWIRVPERTRRHRYEYDGVGNRLSGDRADRTAGHYWRTSKVASMR